MSSSAGGPAGGPGGPVGSVGGTDPHEPKDSRRTGRTREALLDAAAELFTAEGYDRTTVRAIADRAGVNQALLFRYFGNKEALFARVLSAQAMEVLHAGPPDELLERTLRSILEQDAGGHSLIDAALRSAGSSEMVGALRDELGAAYTSELAALATDTGPDATLRAELLLAWLLGINLLRNVLVSDAVAAADPDDVVTYVARAARTMLAGVRPPPS